MSRFDTRKTRRAALLALIPFLAAFFFMLSSTTQQMSLLSAFGLACLALMYVVFCVLANALKRGLWAGYLNLTVLAAWLSAGIVPALLLIIGGSLVGCLIYTWPVRKNYRVWLSEAVGRIAITGNAALPGYAVYSLMGGLIPFHGLERWLSLPALISGVVVQFVVLQLLGVLLTPINPEEHSHTMRKTLLLEVLIALLAVVLPVILFDVGPVAFVIISGLIIAQAFRYQQVTRTEQTLKERMEDMALLSHLGQEMSTRIELDELLEAIYQQMQTLVDASTFFIALYDDEQERIEYPLVYALGHKTKWKSRRRNNGLTDYVIDTGETFYYSHGHMPDIAVTATRANTQAYLGVPLSVGDKILGVMGVTHHTNPHAFNETAIELLETIANQASLAVRNAILYKRTRNMADNLSYINQSLQNVMFNLDRDDSLSAACDIALHITGADKAAVFLVDSHIDRRIRRAFSAGFEPEEELHTLPLDSGVYEDGAIIMVDSHTTDDATLRDLAARGGFRACVQIPLWSGPPLTGVLLVCHDAPHMYDKAELDLLEVLGNQISAALDNTSLLKTLEQYAAEQAQLVHLSRISSSNLDLERIVQDVSETLLHMMNGQHLELALRESDASMIRLYQPDKATGTGVNRVPTVLIPEENVPELRDMTAVRSSGTITIYQHTDETLSAWMNHYLDSRQLSTVAMIPMVINRTAIGVLLLGYERPHYLTNGEQRLLEMATHQITSQVHNARIHMITEEALVQRLEQLSLIEDIAQQISQVLDVNQIIDSVLDAGLQATGAELCALALREHSNSIQFNIIWKTTKEGDIITQQIQMEMSEGVVGQVAQTGNTVLVADTHQLQQYVAPPEDDRDYRSLLAVPLHIGDRIIGVLDLESSQVDFFTAEHAGFIRSLAGHAAISINNADMLDERQQQIHTLTLLRSLALDTVRMMDEKRPITGVILEAALEILDGVEGALYDFDPYRQTATFVEGIKRGDNLEIVRESVFPPSVITAVEEAAHTQASQAIYSETDPDAIDFVAIPVLRRGNVHEIMCVRFAAPRRLDERLLNRIDLLAVQAASHLENAALNEAIRASNDRMRTILDSTRDSIILLNRNGYLQDANAATVGLLGLDLQHHTGKPFDEVIYWLTENETLREIANTYTTDPDSLNEQEYQLMLSPDSEIVTHLKTLVSAVRDADSDRVIGRLLILRDITEEKSLEEFRQKFQSMIIHDLRGPLGGIISAMHLATTIIDADFPDNENGEMLKATLEVSLESGSNLLNLVDTLHNLPTIDRMSIEPERTNLLEIVEQAYNSLSMSLREADIDVEYRIPEDVHELFVDEDLIRRVFINLLQNAFKFTPEDGHIQIAVDEADDDFLRVRISDTGPGIPEDMRDAIFQQGIQIEGRKPRAGGKGSGLGLNFCKLAVEAHGGYIRVEPESPLSGACFAFTLPIYHPSSDTGNSNGRSAAD